MTPCTRCHQLPHTVKPSRGHSVRTDRQTSQTSLAIGCISCIRCSLKSNTDYCYRCLRCLSVSLSVTRLKSAAARAVHAVCAGSFGVAFAECPWPLGILLTSPDETCTGHCSSRSRSNRWARRVTPEGNVRLEWHSASDNIGTVYLATPAHILR